MKNQKNAISWIEIPVLDFSRATKFYNTIFEIEMTEMDMDDTKMALFPYDMEGGGVGGALVYNGDSKPSKDGSAVYLNGGDDLNTVLNRVESAGGKVILPKTEIGMDFGFFAKFEDSEGNHISLHSMA